MELEIQVDLATGRLTYTANGVTLETQLSRPLAAITHIGFAVDSAEIDVSPMR